MPATAIPTSSRFFQPETSVVLYVPTIADPAGPTRVELDAGDDLTDEVADLAGWLVTSAMINTPDLGSKFVSQIGGRTSAEASSITFYADKTGVDVRTILPRGTVGFVVFMDGGDVTGSKMDVFQIEVTSVGKVRSVGDSAHQLTINFAITSEPSEDVAIPATV